MCGLTGFCDFKKELERRALAAANKNLCHRGPDFNADVLIETPNANIGLAHTRLSILDLSANGNQPFYSKDGEIAIIYNGEIYNFREIRKELESRSHSFFSTSDTEVIIHAYEEWGLEAVSRFNGMFAFALLDQEKQMLYLFRDRAGVKPLYYSYIDDRLVFASELKSLVTYPGFERKICQAAVMLFFKYGYIRSPYSIFENTFKVPPGHYIALDINTKKLDTIKYYDVLDQYNQPKLILTEQEALDETEALMTSAFQYRTISDVPVGIFLSGGYDSTLVTALLQRSNTTKLKTFTIGFHEDSYNEAPHAKKIAAYLGTDHHELYCTATDAQNILNTLPGIYDEPLGDSSMIPTLLVSKLARSLCAVSLSADGGDELFAGYERYPNLQKLCRLQGKNTEAGYRKLAAEDVTYFSDEELNRLLPGFNTSIGLYDDIGSIGPENDLINTCLALDYKTYMVDDILAKVDRATMSVGLESREPFLDHRLVEFVARLPSELKYHAGEKKYLLKKITHKYIPQELMDRPKAGFTIPLHQWLKKEFREHLFEYITEEKLRAHGLIDPATALALRDDFLNGKHGNHIQLWFLLMFQMWHGRWGK
jgi:asparagine synthase (glutamine-hydrolysing)